MAGSVEVDETYMGGKNANKHAHKKIKNANGTIGKTVVVGMKDRDTNTVQAAVVERTNQETLQGFVKGITYLTSQQEDYSSCSKRARASAAARLWTSSGIGGSSSVGGSSVMIGCSLSSFTEATTVYPRV